MRLSIVFSGAALLALASAYLLLNQSLAIFTLPMAAITVVLGLLVHSPAGVTVKGLETNSPPMLVDRAVIGASIYQLTFLDAKLVLKRIASSKTTVLSVMILALSGFTLDGIIGAVAGAAGGYALQEYATQRSRSRIHNHNNVAQLAPGDLEFSYSELSEVRLYKRRLLLLGKERIVRIGLPKGYASKMGQALEKLLAGKFRNEASVRLAKASAKQDK